MKQVLRISVVVLLFVIAVAFAPSVAHAQGHNLSAGCSKWGTSPKLLSNVTFLYFFPGQQVSYNAGDTLKVSSTGVFTSIVYLPNGSSLNYNFPVQNFTYMIPALGNYTFAFNNYSPNEIVPQNYYVWCQPA
jgi:hypothetical protein